MLLLRFNLHQDRASEIRQETVSARGATPNWSLGCWCVCGENVRVCLGAWS